MRIANRIDPVFFSAFHLLKLRLWIDGTLLRKRVARRIGTTVLPVEISPPDRVIMVCSDYFRKS
jgi:hypothetical protein